MVSSRADVVRRQWWAVGILGFLALFGIPALVITYTLIDFESIRNDMRAECVEQFPEGSDDRARCIDSADAWP